MKLVKQKGLGLVWFEVLITQGYGDLARLMELLGLLLCRSCRIINVTIHMGIAGP
jgi:hypothetical protein